MNDTDYSNNSLYSRAGKDILQEKINLAACILL